MTQDTQHHEDVAVVTIHFHEDELLELARLLSPALDLLPRPNLHEVRLANAAIRRVISTADDVMHAHQANRRKAKA
jgi:hypothetical protein